MVTASRKAQLFTAGPLYGHGSCSPSALEDFMTTQTPVHQITWSRDYDRARQESASDRLPLLIDFTAAPL
jgi:hypothetical protein